MYAMDGLHPQNTCFFALRVGTVLRPFESAHIYHNIFRQTGAIQCLTGERYQLHTVEGV